MTRTQTKKKRPSTLPGGTVVSPGTILDVIAELQAGLPFRHLTQFLKDTQLPEKPLLASLQIPRRTLMRRRRSGRLSPRESERLYRISRLHSLAVGLFEDGPAATRWLTSPARAFGGVTPLEMAKFEVGGREVEDLIGRIEDGVFC